MGQLLRHGNIILLPLVLSVGSLLFRIKQRQPNAIVIRWGDGIIHRERGNLILNPITTPNSITTRITPHIITPITTHFFTHILTTTEVIIVITALIPPLTAILITVIGGSNVLYCPKKVDGGNRNSDVIVSFDEHLMFKVSQQETLTQVDCW